MKWTLQFDTKMKKFTLILFFFCAWMMAVSYPGSAQLPVQKIRIILDTDIGPDYDDAGAMAVLHAMADSGKVQILGTFSSNKDSLVVPTIDLLNTWFGRPGILTGSPKKGGVSISSSQHWPDSLVSRFPHKIKSSRSAPDAVTGYRRVLAEQPDNSVTIVTIGFLTNLGNLLQSPPDQLSKLNGKELVARKVKRLVCMAGGFPMGKEFNVDMDAAASKYCFENWPGEIIFSGFEIGEKIKTGLRLVRKSGPDNPVREAFRIAMTGSAEDRGGRMSWDQTAVIIAVYGTDPFFTTVRGSIKVNNDGSNAWENNPLGKHSYVRFNMTPESIGQFIEDRMMHIPLKK